MKLRMIDAIDLFGLGGYIDLKSQQYVSTKVPPMEQINTDDIPCRIDSSNEYLVAPIIRSTYIAYMAARQLGVSHETLSSLGFISDFYREIFYPSEETPFLRKNGYTDAEWTVIESVSAYMRKVGQYKAYVTNSLKLRHEIITNWLSEHGIEVC